MPTDHEAVKAKSYANLRRARELKPNYNSDNARASIILDLRQRMAQAGRDEFTPRSWQVDVGEALQLKQDCVVLVPTGGGKTLPFTIAIQNGGILLVISPLDALQADHVSAKSLVYISRLTIHFQAARFCQMGYRAEAVNSENWRSDKGMVVVCKLFQYNPPLPLMD